VSAASEREARGSLRLCSLKTSPLKRLHLERCIAWTPSSGALSRPVTSVTQCEICAPSHECDSNADCSKQTSARYFTPQDLSTQFEI
jgi:hypothetical protein